MRNILFIRYQQPQRIPNGGDQCTNRNFHLLCNIVGDENVHSLYIHNNKKRFIKIILALFLFKKGYYYGLTPALVQQIIHTAQNYDCVFVDRSLFGIIAYKLKESGYKGIVITHFHNVESIYMDEAKLPKRLPFRNTIINCADQNDKWSMQYADKVIVLNHRDEQELFKMYGRHADLILPIALPDTCPLNIDHQPLISHKPHCLTIGSYFAPNNDGIIWFIRNVLPHVNISYTVVGKNMNKLKEDYPDLFKDIDVISDAESLTPYFLDADIMILPIFSGSGMKVKTCESLMYGKHILGTSEAFEGYEGDYSQIGGICDTSEQFIDGIKRLSDSQKTRFNQYSRSLFMEHYSYMAAIENLKQILV